MTGDLVAHPWEAVIGRWRTSGTVLDAHGDPVATIDGTDEYEWMLGGRWIVHRVDVVMGEDRVQALEVIGEHDAVADTYVMRVFDGAGGYGTMTAHPNGDGSWIFLGGGMRSVLRPSADRSFMTARWERQDDSGAWLRWMDMRFDAMD